MVKLTEPATIAYLAFALAWVAVLIWALVSGRGRPGDPPDDHHGRKPGDW